MKKRTRKSKMIKKKEVVAMMTAVRLLEDENIFAQEMKCYLVELQKQKDDSQEVAYEEAKKALQRTGVITKNGKTKKKIVSWE